MSQNTKSKYKKEEHGSFASLTPELRSRSCISRLLLGSEILASRPGSRQAGTRLPPPLVTQFPQADLCYLHRTPKLQTYKW